MQTTSVCTTLQCDSVTSFRMHPNDGALRTTSMTCTTASTQPLSPSMATTAGTSRRWRAGTLRFTSLQIEDCRYPPPVRTFTVMNKPALNTVPAWIEGALSLKTSIARRKLLELNKASRMRRRLRGKQTVEESEADLKTMNKQLRAEQRKSMDKLQPKVLRSMPYGQSILDSICDLQSPRNH